MTKSLRNHPRVVVACCAVGCVLLGTSLEAQWELIDSATFVELIPAGETCCLAVQSSTDSIDIHFASQNLTSAAQNALGVAPAWLRMELWDNLRRLSATHQDFYAGMINDATHPYVDEICFQVAHIAPQTLTGTMTPDVLLENVESLYAADAHLDYVEIVDRDLGEGYYSTVVYRVLEGEETLEIELPRDLYYWYIVHPKLHKETPNYINPDTGGPAAPPTGVFWRDFLMNSHDTGYPLLRTALEGCSVLWKCQPNTVDNGAVGAVTQWIQDVMTFQSHQHHSQPVRIYRWHIGTCSVHSYLTSAAARAALIPTAVSVMYSDNHKINEFWDRRWVAWEPVNTFIDYPEGYENWGWDVAAVFNWRGDSFIWDTTERYTEVCTLRVSVCDDRGEPVDGARVRLYSSPCTGWGATAGWTNHSGQKEFLLGDERNFIGQVTSSIGTYPPSGMETVISFSQAGSCYNWDVVLPGTVPGIDVSPDSWPEPPPDAYRLVVKYSVPAETLYGDNYDDANRFSERSGPGQIDFFVCDQENFDHYASGEPFAAGEIGLGSPSDSVDVVLASPGLWYAVFSNKSDLVLTQEVEITAELYARPPAVVAEDRHGDVFPRHALYPNHPNPFHADTRIAFDLTHECAVELAIFNVAGQRVRTLVDGFQTAGRHTSRWDGRDDNGNVVGSGVYLYEMRTEGSARAGRMLLVR